MALDFLVQLLVNGFIIGLLYGVVAMAFVLIYKSSLVVNFAQGEFLLVGSKVFLTLLFSVYIYTNFYDNFWNINSDYNSKTFNWRTYNINNNGYNRSLYFFSGFNELDVWCFCRTFS